MEGTDNFDGDGLARWVGEKNATGCDFFSKRIKFFAHRLYSRMVAMKSGAISGTSIPDV